MARRLIAARHLVPLQAVAVSRHRQVAQADLGLDRSVQLMVHGNARVYPTVVLAVAEELAGGPWRRDAFGCTARAVAARAPAGICQIGTE